jgi:hypothetical protein
MGIRLYIKINLKETRREGVELSWARDSPVPFMDAAGSLACSQDLATFSQMKTFHALITKTPD